jgi:hypothetical protein
MIRRQYFSSNSKIGIGCALPVWTRLSASNSSSKVP